MYRRSSSRTLKNNSHSSLNIKPTENISGGTTKNGIRWISKGTQGNVDLDIYLKNGEKIVADKHSLVLMDGSVKLETKSGNFFKGIGRMFSGETFFLNYFEGTNPSKPSRLTLGSGFPGDIIYIPIKEGEKWRLSKGVFLAGTENIVVSSSTKIKSAMGSIFGGEGLILSEVSCYKGDGGFWISAYGHIEKHTIKANETLLVNNYFFLASLDDVNINLKKIGSIKSIISGGEGVAMEFKGPCEIYTQSKSIQGLAKNVGKYIYKGNKTDVLAEIL